MLKPKAKVLRPVHPNAGIAAAYRARIVALLGAMARSYAYWIAAAYRASPPEIAQDASPAAELNALLNRLGRHWQRRFNEAAPDLARYFTKSASRRSDAALKSILKKHGISVDFKMTAAMNDILQATVAENVGLIRSIPQQLHTKVQGLVMRSVQTGRDLSSLSRELQKQFGVTKRRAALISLDQNNKATSALMRARQTEMGIEEGQWLHSHAGKTPRRTHLSNHGKRFKLAKGWYDPDPRVKRHILPGELINCRCTWKPVVKGFT
jgi:SPP1 gp7 family putative phage head morphogenesis protein